MHTVNCIHFNGSLTLCTLRLIVSAVSFSNVVRARSRALTRSILRWAVAFVLDYASRPRLFMNRKLYWTFSRTVGCGCYFCYFNFCYVNFFSENTPICYRLNYLMLSSMKYTAQLHLLIYFIIIEFTANKLCPMLQFQIVCVIRFLLCIRRIRAKLSSEFSTRLVFTFISFCSTLNW